MRWPFGRRRDSAEADEAIDRARGAITDARNRSAEVNRIVRDLRYRRTQNHFGEGIMRILRDDEP